MYSIQNNKIDIWPTEIPTITIIHKEDFKSYLIRQYNIHIFNKTKSLKTIIYRIRQIKTIEKKVTYLNSNGSLTKTYNIIKKKNHNYKLF